MPSATWLLTGKGFPSDGVRLETTYKSGSATSWIYHSWFDPILAPALGGSLCAGSLNLWAADPVHLPSPARALVDGIEWHFVPMIIREVEVAVAARKAIFGDIPFIEVFARQHLASKLGLSFGDRVDVQLFSGEHLALAA